MKEYYANGKLLISGEYMVLKGALALAIPVKYGQSMEISENGADNGIVWETFVRDELWFSAEFNPSNLHTTKTSDHEISRKLTRVLDSIEEIKPGFFGKDMHLHIKSKLNFDIEWGLGSSSSLISNLADWAGIDPYLLHSKVSNGSGYDVACARIDSPLLYYLSEGEPVIEIIDFHPPFSDRLFLVYLGNKQDSYRSVNQFLDNEMDFTGEIEKITGISRQIPKCLNLEEFSRLIVEHEEVMAELLNRKPVKKALFPDFPGEVKSLGAWGGDFVLAASELDRGKVRKYFMERGYDQVFDFNEMVLNERS